MLNVTRKTIRFGINEDYIMVGDQISIPLEGFGTFTATAQAVDNESSLFIFDEIVARQPMNRTDTNKGGFEGSELYKWLQETLLPAFPEEIRSRIKNLTIPTVGQITGWSDKWDRENLEPDNDKQFPLMKDRKNRIATYEKDGLMWYWLRNATKKDCSASSFAIVYSYGNANCYGASNSLGVCPVFRLIKEKSGGHVPQGNRVSYRSYYAERPRRVISEETLLGEIEEKTKEIEQLKKELENLRRIAQYDEGATETKALMDSFIRAGFTEKQAFDMIKGMLVAVFGGMLK